MGFVKNKKGSGMILTGAFVVPAAMSSVQQGVVSATPGGYVDETATQSLLGKVWQSKLGKAGVLTVGVLVLIAAFVLFEKSKKENKVEGFDENNGGVEGTVVVRKDDFTNIIISEKQNSNSENKVEESKKGVVINKTDLSEMTPEEREFSNFIRTTKSSKVRFLTKRTVPSRGKDKDWEWIYRLEEFDLNTSKEFLEDAEKRFAEREDKEKSLVDMFDECGTDFHTEVFSWSLCGYVDDANKVHVFYKEDIQAIRSNFMSKEIDGGGKISEVPSFLILIFD